ncbi:MAG: glycosyltransferase family 39 protein [Devosia sp.]|nr:glycosyltransferase family 39 protein [Devosia sp.]
MLGFVLYAAIGVRWIALYRHAHLVDIDEAGYFAIALNNYFALVSGGLRGWIASISAPSVQAPITTALASLAFAMFGPHLVVGFLVPLGLSLLTILATYLLGRVASARAGGVLSALLVASTPLLINYSRDFHFAAAATLATTLTLLALELSDRFQKWHWVVLFGVALGTMPLARTVTIAFIPGIVLAAALSASAAPQQRSERLLRLLVALAVAVAVAMTWLWSSGRSVFEYLFSFGYGARAAEYGAKTGLLEGIRIEAAILLQTVYMPHALLLLAGVVAGLVVFLRAAWADGPATAAAKAFRSPAMPLLVFAVFSTLALASSQNKGSAFVAPLLPALLVLSVYFLLGLARSRPFQNLVGLAVVAVSVVAFVPAIDLALPISAAIRTTLPYFGSTPVTDGEGALQLYEANNGVNETAPGRELAPELTAAWLALSEQTAAMLASAPDSDHPTAFGFRGVVYNVNTVNLVLLQTTGHRLPFVQIAPTVTGDTVEGYKAWLTTGEAGKACLLLTATGAKAEFPPAVNTPALATAAQGLGFLPQAKLTMPNGRQVTLLHRPCP